MTHATDSDVVVVAVTYNSSDVIEPFLQALPAALDGIPNFRVVIVDNASSDSTVDTVKAVAPWVTVIDSGGNFGYAAAINIGLRTARAARGVMILNPDTVPGNRCITRLVDAAEQGSSIGITVPRIADPAGLLSKSLRREPTVLRALGEAVLGGGRASRFPRLSEVIGNVNGYVDGTIADWATGAAMFVTTDALDAVGSWDEQFFLYSEETDFALRARDEGFDLQYVAGAEVLHIGGDLGTSPWLWSLQAINRTKLYRKRHGTLSSSMYWCAVMTNEVIRAASGPKHRAAIRALLRGRVPIPSTPRYDTDGAVVSQ